MKESLAPVASSDAPESPVQTGQGIGDWGAPLMQEPTYVSDSGVAGIAMFLIVAFFLVLALVWYYQPPPAPPPQLQQ